MSRPARRPVTVDVGLVAAALAVGVALLIGSAHVRPYDAPELDPRPLLLPLYLLRSLSRLLVSYAAAVVLALGVGHLAARSPVARRLILPTLDVLQSVPILGFFPAAVGLFIGLFGGSALGVEAAAVFLIFTSMFWNLAFGVYESLITLPEDLALAARQFGLRGTLHWTRLVLPVVMPSLLYNSILSWANGWYFLIASEIIAVGPARYTLPGLGSYLGQAIARGDPRDTWAALAVLAATTVGLHVLVWSPLGTWAERFYLEESGSSPRTPRVAQVLGRSRLVQALVRFAAGEGGRRVLSAVGRLLSPPYPVALTLRFLAAGALLTAAWEAGGALGRTVVRRPLSPEAAGIPLDLLLSLGRVTTGVGLAVALALPLAYWTFRRSWARSLFLWALQVVGSVPAVAFFPVIALVMVELGLGMNVGSVVLVLTGTFFYVMFNVLSGAMAIPREMNEAAGVLGLRGLRYVRHVFVPAVLPSLVTGCVTAWGGGWNAIIFSEYVVSAGRTYAVRGIGATLDRATYVTGDLQVVALSLASMVVLIVLVNRLLWDRVYEQVAARYKMEA